MLRYTLKRLLGAIPTLFLVIVLAFTMVRLAPGGPFSYERALPDKTREALEAKYNLDDPLPVQFWDYLSGVVTGNFGPSYIYSDFDVDVLIAQKFPLSMTLGLLSIVLALIVGLAAGILAALNRNTLTDRVVMGFAMTGISIPVFVVAPVLVLFLAVKLNWFPAGWSGGSGAGRLVLPVIALALPQIAYIARLSRASLIEVLSSDFVRTARAQGLGSAAIIRHHALKPALLPVLSYLGPAVAAVLTGSVVVEQVFSIPGLGRLFIESATQPRDAEYLLDHDRAGQYGSDRRAKIGQHR